MLSRRRLVYLPSTRQPPCVTGRMPDWLGTFPQFRPFEALWFRLQSYLLHCGL
ncbi:protein of unknown function [Micropruina glycogenica]|uniref:Uncharacterized protein n=1 Tax=Micropruina glycogenica TaxID=75385 RepID=A0A2N9JCQ3_9ACTN|nr:protein of unknown function [Micropruina glycogenica]